MEQVDLARLWRLLVILFYSGNVIHCLKNMESGKLKLQCPLELTKLIKMAQYEKINATKSNRYLK